MSEGLIVGERLLKGSDSIKRWSLMLDGAPGFSLATKCEQFCSDMISCWDRLPNAHPQATEDGAMGR